MEAQAIGTSIDLVRFLTVAEAAAADIIRRNNALVGEVNPRHQGVHICLRSYYEPADWPPLLVARFGEFPDHDRIVQTHAFSQEKAARLVNYSSISSYQTRDEKKNQYGGAIRAGDRAISSSGFPEDRDEALDLSIALQLDWCTTDQAIDIAEISKNEFFLSQDWPTATGTFKYRG